MSQIQELKMCDLTPTCLSSDSGSYQQLPNPEGEASIKEPLSPTKGSVLKNIDKPGIREMMEIIVCKIGNLRVSEKKKILQVNLLNTLDNKNLEL